MKKLNVLVALLVAALMAAPALAGTVVLPGLVNTGGTGVVGTLDADYDLQFSPFPNDYDVSDGFRFPEYMKVADIGAYEVYKPKVWVTPPQGANWIGPNPSGDNTDGLSSDRPGWYFYTLKFDVSAGMAPYLEVSGNWATDNDSIMQLNGVELTGIYTGPKDFGKLTPFVVNGFEAGVNKLTFIVRNLPLPGNPDHGNPTGLLVCDLTAKVPEPASVAVWSVLCAIAGIAIWRRRK